MNNDNIGGSFRTKRNPFTQVSNSALRDNNLSLKAKGLYSLIQSYITIPNFTLYKGYLMSMCREKEKAFDSAWKELKTNGYLKQYRIPKGKNDSFVYEYELLDIADLTTPSLINLNKNGEEVKPSDKDTTNANSHTPHLVPYANSTLCEADPVPTAPNAKRGENNNIDLKKDFKEKDLNTNTESKSKSDATVTNDTDPQQEILDMKKELPQTYADQSQSLQSSSQNAQFSFDYTTYEEIIKRNISYDVFLQDKRDIDLVNNFVACMVDTLLTDDGVTIIIGKEKKPIGIVKSVLMKLNHEHIQHAIDQFKGQHHKITRKRPYIRNTLYNTYHEMDAHYTNAVRADGVVW